jgi:hypothetical protein
MRARTVRSRGPPRFANQSGRRELEVPVFVVERDELGDTSHQ